jgi:tetratricopeptide (TPR) repeat protein
MNLSSPRKSEGKKSLKSSVQIFSLVLISSMLFSCATPAVKTTSLIPARFHEATKLKEVAVLPFDGHNGREFAAEIEGAIGSINVDNKRYFTLIERARIEEILKEQELSQTGIIDEMTAAKVGKLVGAKGIFTGAVTVANTRDSHYAQNRKECSKREIKYDRKGNPYEGDCIHWRNYTVSCTKRNATFALTPKLIEVETGRIIYSNNISEMTTASACSDSGAPLASGFELIAKAKETSKGTFKRDIAPSYVTFDIKLMDSKEGIASKEAAEKLDLGMNYAKKSRLDRACELWEEGRILSPNSPSLIYNLAICAEVRGDLEKSLDLYKMADRALNKPDDKITAGIGRVSEALREQQTLSEQLK